ncbi:MAG: hypothetical protein MUF62_06215 [Chitinophagaceae bacterium]|nr:hypothetical protein [Chitinophagaceae bacterium]
MKNAITSGKRSLPIGHWLQATCCGVAILLSTTLAAQFAYVQDPDSFVYVRQGPAVYEARQDSLRNGHLVYLFEKNGNWTNIDYWYRGIQKTGYVYSNRLKSIDDFPALKLVSNNGREVKLSGYGIEVFVSRQPFDPAKHRFSYHKTYKDVVTHIDGQIVWGTDGEKPKTQYAGIRIQQNGQVYPLPAAALRQLYEPSLENTKAYYDSQTGTLFIQSMNSDGAGSYEVLWQVQHGRYVQRLLVNGF